MLEFLSTAGEESLLRRAQEVDGNFLVCSEFILAEGCATRLVLISNDL